MKPVFLKGAVRASCVKLHFYKPWIVLPILFFCLMPALDVRGEDDEVDVVIAIEEDWVLKVGDPDTNSAGPQISCTISPVGDLNGLHAVFALNHRSQPDFKSGGLQLQLWNGEQQIAYKDFSNTGLLCHQSESIHWTSRMKLVDNNIVFEILNGNSLSWNQFGGQGSLKHTCGSSIQNLKDYKPCTTVQNSGIGYASNRVDKLFLKELRVYMQSGKIFTNNTERVVHE